jgi:DNA polymerase elongation subunit (family B)
MLETVAEAQNAKEFEERIPKALDVIQRYALNLMGWRASADDLAIYRQLTRHPLAYRVRAHTAIAARQMLDAGVELHPGQGIAYVVTRAGARNPNLRVRALPLIGKGAKYDRRRYLDLLIDSGEELFRPFGYTRQKICENIKGRGFEL